VSLKKLLGKILIFGMLEIGALAGVPMTPEDIEKIMNVMHRTKVVHIVKKDDDVT
jgi:hypothetical protein